MQMPCLYSYIAASFKSLSWKLQKLRRHKPYYAMFMRQIFLVNPGYVTLAIKIWSEFCDLHAHALPIFLLCCKFQIIILKTVQVGETQTILCHLYDAIFWVNPGYATLAIKNWSEFCDLYVHAQPIFLLCCKFRIIILKTVGAVMEAWTLLCHVYKAIFLSK